MKRVECAGQLWLRFEEKETQKRPIARGFGRYNNFALCFLFLLSLISNKIKRKRFSLFSISPKRPPRRGLERSPFFFCSFVYLNLWFDFSRKWWKTADFGCNIDLVGGFASQSRDIRNLRFLTKLQKHCHWQSLALDKKMENLKKKTWKLFAK